QLRRGSIRPLLRPLRAPQSPRTANPPVRVSHHHDRAAPGRVPGRRPYRTPDQEKFPSQLQRPLQLLRLDRVPRDADRTRPAVRAPVYRPATQRKTRTGERDDRVRVSTPSAVPTKSAQSAPRETSRTLPQRAAPLPTTPCSFRTRAVRRCC